jgi:hypothetical protein
MSAPSKATVNTDRGVETSGGSFELPGGAEPVQVVAKGSFGQSHEGGNEVANTQGCPPCAAVMKRSRLGAAPCRAPSRHRQSVAKLAEGRFSRPSVLRVVDALLAASVVPTPSRDRQVPYEPLDVSRTTDSFLESGYLMPRGPSSRSQHRRCPGEIRSCGPSSSVRLTQPMLIGGSL